MNIITVPIDSLNPDPVNARKHDKKNLDAIQASLSKFGQVEPLVVQKSTHIIIGGNGRFEAMKSLGIKDAAIVEVDLDATQSAALAIALNRTSELAEWDKDILGKLLQGLQEDGLDLGEIGFDLDDLGEFKGIDFGTSGITEENQDDIPEVKESFVKRGEIWQLGDHRLMCGDSTDSESVLLLFGSEKPMLMMTDPPYGVKLDQSWRDKALGDKSLGKGNKNIVSNDGIADWSNAWCHFPGDVAYVWHAGKFSDVVMNSIRSVGFEVCQQIIWNKSIMVMGRNDYHFKHEPCWYAVRKGKTHRWSGDRKQTTVIDAKSPNHIMSGSKEEKTNHPTQKPVDCMMLIKNHDGDVYDPFLGSGTTLIACEKTNRRCFGMELDEHYCSIIIKRWQDLTGKTAVKLG